MTRLDGLVALVTGGASGIGAAVCGMLATGGAVVFDGRATSTFPALDVRDPASIQAHVAHAGEVFGAIDIVVNAAGIQRYGNVESTTDEVWDEVLSVNLTGAFRVIRAAMPYLLVRGGSIVNISSVQSRLTQTDVVAYTASKGGLNALTRAIAVDYARRGVRCNAVCPGSVDTPMLRTAAQLHGCQGESADDVIRRWGDLHPVGRVATGAEIANVVVFLAGPDSSFVTGAEIFADGGVTAAVGVSLTQ
jgi:NAD(P)-dependent dehydrogenase (short-subunit alcohol dehydrogenase family)